MVKLPDELLSPSKVLLHPLILSLVDVMDLPYYYVVVGDDRDMFSLEFICQLKSSNECFLCTLARCSWLGRQNEVHAGALRPLR